MFSGLVARYGIACRLRRHVTSLYPDEAYLYYNTSTPRRYSQRGRSLSPTDQELGRLRDLRGFARGCDHALERWSRKYFWLRRRRDRRSALWPPSKWSSFRLHKD